MRRTYARQTARADPPNFPRSRMCELKSPGLELPIPKRPRGRFESARSRFETSRLVDTEDEFPGLWVSEGGSVYSFDGNCFVCLAVHSDEYRGWIGQIAVDEVLRIGSVGCARQAIRCKTTGVLARWEPVVLDFESRVVTKHFPALVPSGVLVYGHTERYFRVNSAGRKRRAAIGQITGS